MTLKKKKVAGSKERPRLVIYRSLNHIYAQIIDDLEGKTMVAASSMKIKGKGKKSERAKAVGQEIAKAAKTKGIEAVVFDRGRFPFHGRVKALADGAREGGLKF